MTITNKTSGHLSLFSSRVTRSVLSGAALVALTAGLASQARADMGDSDPVESIVITDTKFNTDAAPAKASLDTTEPQTIINRSYIRDFVPPQADYVTILAIVPSMTGGDPNGPGLSDGGAKNTLRGLPDGDFVMQYDGIPFGDTNGPTHHNISYFPASTIGSVVVDRGPGNAGNLGAATYGGTIKLFSQTLSATPEGSASISYGSWGTFLGVATGETGDIDFLGKTRILIDAQSLSSDGALTLQDTATKNALMKVESTLSPNWTATLFGDFSFLKENLSDNNGLTLAQVAAYGKNFSLQNTNPTLPTYQAYNYTTKQTDLEYFKVDGTLSDSLKVENTVYTYAYWNHTMSPNSQTQTTSQIAGDTSSDNGTVTLLNGTKLTNSLLAYDKQNEYRVWGDIVRGSADFDFGGVTGQARVGIWLEDQETHRFKYYFDSNLCNQDGVDPFFGGGSEVGSEALAAATCGAVKGSAKNGALGYAKDDEYSHWYQYEPFLEVDIRPIDNLVITPGVKYIHWNLGVDAPVEQGNTCGIDKACLPDNGLGQNYVTSFDITDTLPFLQVNYKLNHDWSVYFEYAKGIYVPDLSAFENSTPTLAFPKPETTTNYQLGTVFYADQFTFDADVYYIPINNNYITQPCAYDTSDTCYVNNGAATYKGIEGEGTYAFDHLAGLDVHGLSVFLNGAIMSSKAQNGTWEPNAPNWTAAAGILYKQHGWTYGLIEKIIGAQYSDAANTDYLKLPSYGNLNSTLGYSFGKVDLSVNVDNLLNSRAVVSISGSAGPGQDAAATSTNQYFFQAPRSFMATLKAHF